jgi:ABC-2 type transport system ATP-binding protein
MNDAGTTILLTTHYIEEAERLCDRVCILDRGRKVEEASPDELQGRGTDTLYVQLRHPPETTPEFDIEAVESVSLDDGRLVVRAKQGGRTAPRVLRALDYAGLEVVDLDIARTSLEDVFVDLTERRDQGVEA